MGAYTVLVLCTSALTASGFLIKVPTVNLQPKVDEVQNGWLRMQKMILPFFDNVCEESVDSDIIAAANDFNVAVIKNSNFVNTGSSIQFTNVEVITNLQKLLSAKGLIPKGEIFTEYKEEHLNELKIIFEMLCCARNFDSFYKAAAWARQNVNCGLFIDAIYLSLMNRRETNLLSIPAPYEILPNYFIRKDYIAKASSLMSVEEPYISDGIRNEGNAYIIDANYTADYYNNADESVLAYFHEDIGLNSYYFLRKLKNAPWFVVPTDPTNANGEFLYFTLKQLAARYDLERYSNGLPELDEINWDDFRIVPYDSMLIYSNGDNFASRLYETDITENDITDVPTLKDIENNISTYVTHMMQYIENRTGYNRKQIINNLMEILITKDKSYSMLASTILKKGLDGTIAPMDHYMTSLRDPMFWLLNKKIVTLVEKSLENIPQYTRSTLYFPGIEILSVDAKKMMTMCDSFEIDVTDALKSNLTKTPYQVKFAQQRLNHKPFSIKITVDSRTRQKGIIKIFLGPKTLPGELSKKKNSFMLLDCFDTNFKIGTNVISRSSDAMTNLSNDFETLRSIRRKVLDAEFGLYMSPTNLITKQTSFPSRLIIPKGSTEGLPFQLFVFITPYVSSVEPLALPKSVDLMSELILSPGYPLDLSIDDFTLLDLPNAMLKDIVITHKETTKASDYGNDGGAARFTNDFAYDSSSQNQPPYGKRQPFDYKSKRGDYGTNKKSANDNKDKNETPKAIEDFTYEIYPKNQTGEINLKENLTKDKINEISTKTDNVKLIIPDETDKKVEKFDKVRLLKSSMENQNIFDYKAKRKENEKKRAEYKKIRKDSYDKKDEDLDTETMKEVLPVSKGTSEDGKEDEALTVIPLLTTSTKKLNDFFLFNLRDYLKVFY